MAAVFLPKSILQYGCSHIVCFLINQSFLWVPVELTEKNDLCPAAGILPPIATSSMGTFLLNLITIQDLTRESPYLHDKR